MSQIRQVPTMSYGLVIHFQYAPTWPEAETGSEMVFIDCWNETRLTTRDLISDVDESSRLHQGRKLKQASYSRPTSAATSFCNEKSSFPKILKVEVMNLSSVVMMVSTQLFQRIFKQNGTRDWEKLVPWIWCFISYSRICEDLFIILALAPEIKVALQNMSHAQINMIEMLFWKQTGELFQIWQQLWRMRMRNKYEFVIPVFKLYHEIQFSIAFSRG